MKHREEVAKYTPGFVIDPWNENEAKTVSPNDVALQVGFALIYKTNDLIGISNIVRHK